MMRSAVTRLTPFITAILVIACGGSLASPTPGASQSGMFSPGIVPTSDQLCQLLTPADWTAAGLTGAQAPFVDDDGAGTGSAYCTYSGDSGASGGLELDVFVGPTIDDANQTYATIAESIPTPTAPNLSGVDVAILNTNIEPGFGAILVRAGKLVVTISLPTSTNAANQMTSLTSLVLDRAKSLE